MFFYCFIVVCGVIFHQDFKERKVSVLLFVIAFLVGGILHFKNTFSEIFLYTVLVNSCFVLFLSLLLSLYSKLKMKKALFKTIGLGDLFFFGVLAISFPTFTFLVLFSTSLIFSLFVFLIMKPQLKKRTVPLAGLQALFLNLVLILNELFNFVNLYAI